MKNLISIKIIEIAHLKKIFIVPKPHGFINVFLKSFFFFLLKNFLIYIRKKKFNLKIIALLLSAFIILCIKFIFNYYNYVINVSLLFIVFCSFLKPIVLVIIEYIDEINFFRYKKNVCQKDKYFFYNNDKIASISYYIINIYNIHIPLTLEKLKNVNNLYEVDIFFRFINEQEINRHKNKLKELVYKAVLTKKLQKELIIKIEEEYVLFKELLYNIEKNRCIYIVFLRVKKNLKY